ncbi:hypothetical protein DB88DRAFT_503076 [Papiliotrema laurentii]|jgi:SP family general alpha glucoside:H+ symporter-like MFS transporter|uniref:Major facilitator superfamily (MFS) profile domain-containing protein n=1 Tax=Papiliotrema laurentii TaxID=5418 RepID=A0AAD9CRP4_PAPLA|nr:hypothetical protein DB88DRAFT_503452 [Papiliotrema laurentii]KAK1920599.1 hypothetical protein DB88DRAFT_503288 [Papiliotrema laurentii]KAK1920622.1 hypothetical protein DB88DRAFT_503076 [Papiliotrema laurentii]
MISDNELNCGLNTCFFFAGLSFILVVATCFVLPETAKRSPAELDELFEKKVKPWRFRQTVTEVQRCRLEQAAGNLEVRANQVPDLSCQRTKDTKSRKWR